jgi:phosphate transport system protein
MEREHTSREFEKELKVLRERLLSMGGRAEQQLERAIAAIVNRSDADARLVIDDDVKIDQDEIDIDELAFMILARRQPVASDLRFVMLALKVVSDLERIGDLAVNIAKRSRDLNRHEPSNQVHLNLLTDKVLDALKGALDAFANTDIAAAERVIMSDHDIDSLNMHVIADVIATGAEHAHEIARRLAISSVSRYLERIGDHATNICEMVIYYAHGRDVRHHLTPYPRPTRFE